MVLGRNDIWWTVEMAYRTLHFTVSVVGGNVKSIRNIQRNLHLGFWSSFERDSWFGFHEGEAHVGVHGALSYNHCLVRWSLNGKWTLKHINHLLWGPTYTGRERDRILVKVLSQKQGDEESTYADIGRTKSSIFVIKSNCSIYISNNK